MDKTMFDALQACMVTEPVPRLRVNAVPYAMMYYATQAADRVAKLFL